MRWLPQKENGVVGKGGKINDGLGGKGERTVKEEERSERKMDRFRKRDEDGGGEDERERGRKRKRKRGGVRVGGEKRERESDELGLFWRMTTILQSTVPPRLFRVLAEDEEDEGEKMRILSPD
ncbi:hypothetical protein ASPWEDRAFT_202606 [Aspergillus wentii DTO 134E9]|uniref:Uncharacterized protein n=1 Tax=Aspergillus wentii DTO 134E9 TaxID=1073089 RepID=A0A1L9RZJ1_ASPWE|nr:uncharacterized protein ASPWEDRAFT_202606 [Aspergillus wentii DTO 134E9]OJJ40325.1 hypothetical protein ASPWEDRAFT_202606 [Aspergillus wentii DTO 134E9]